MDTVSWCCRHAVRRYSGIENPECEAQMLNVPCKAGVLITGIAPLPSGGVIVSRGRFSRGEGNTEKGRIYRYSDDGRKLWSIETEGGNESVRQATDKEFVSVSFGLTQIGDHNEPADRIIWRRLSDGEIVRSIDVQAGRSSFNLVGDAVAADAELNVALIRFDITKRLSYVQYVTSDGNIAWTRDMGDGDPGGAIGNPEVGSNIGEVVELSVLPEGIVVMSLASGRVHGDQFPHFSQFILIDKADGRSISSTPAIQQGSWFGPFRPEGGWEEELPDAPPEIPLFAGTYFLRQFVANSASDIYAIGPEIEYDADGNSLSTSIKLASGSIEAPGQKSDCPYLGRIISDRSGGVIGLGYELADGGHQGLWNDQGPYIYRHNHSGMVWRLTWDTDPPEGALNSPFDAQHLALDDMGRLWVAGNGVKRCSCCKKKEGQKADA